MDIEIINELFNACLEADRGVENRCRFQQEIEEGDERFTADSGWGKRYNTIQEWIEDYEEVEPGHRHISHLFGLYPGTTINASNKELFEAARPNHRA